MEKSRGRVSENPITRVRHTFLVLGEETGGEYERVRAELPPHAQGPPMHFHLSYTERFEVLEGQLDVYVGKRNHAVLAPGASAFAPLKVPHRFWNATDEPTVFEAEIRPADNFEKAIRVADGMARDGKTNAKGVPKNPSSSRWPTNSPKATCGVCRCSSRGRSSERSEARKAAWLRARVLAVHALGDVVGWTRVCHSRRAPQE